MADFAALPMLKAFFAFSYFSIFLSFASRIGFARFSYAAQTSMSEFMFGGFGYARSFGFFGTLRGAVAKPSARSWAFAASAIDFRSLTETPARFGLLAFVFAFVFFVVFFFAMIAYLLRLCTNNRPPIKTTETTAIFINAPSPLSPLVV